MNKHNLIFGIVFIFLTIFTQSVSAEFFRGQPEESESLQDVFQEFTHSLLIMRLVDDKGRIGDEAEPTVKKIGNDLVICAWNIEIYFHLEQYYTQLLPKLVRALSSLDEEGKEPITVARNTPKYKMASSKPIYAVTPFHNYPLRFGKIDEGIKNDSNDHLLIFVNIGRDKWGTNQRFKIFYLEKQKYKEIFRKLLFPYPLKMKIVLETPDRRTIREDYIDCSYSLVLDQNPDRDSKVSINAKRFNLSQSGGNSNSFLMTDNNNSFIISPEFNFGREYIPLFDDSGKYNTSSSDAVLGDTIMVRYEVTMSEADLKHLGTVRLSWK